MRNAPHIPGPRAEAEAKADLEVARGQLVELVRQMTLEDPPFAGVDHLVEQATQKLTTIRLAAAYLRDAQP